jgi:hypothetical protein
VVPLRRFNLACACLLACVCAAAALGAARAAAGEKASRGALVYLNRQAASYRSATWRWERTMGVELTRIRQRSLAAASVSDLRGTVARWRRRAHLERVKAQHPPHLATWLCIHRYEGSWTDREGPYYGGLQMDVRFQRLYAPRLYRLKGTADHWTPLEQIWTAVRAAKTRGFWPWPNSARMCGVL